MKKTARLAVITLAAALTLTGCGDRGDTSNNSSDQPSETTSASPSPTASNPDFKACMVSDSGGFEDKSFNQTSHDGLVNAEEDMGDLLGGLDEEAGDMGMGGYGGGYSKDSGLYDY